MNECIFALKQLIIAINNHVLKDTCIKIYIQTEYSMFHKMNAVVAM